MRVKSVLGIVFSFYLLMMVGVNQSAFGLTYQSTIGTGVAGNGNDQFEFPTGVEVDSLGNIYVSDRDNNRIQMFDSSGTYVRTLGVTDDASCDTGKLMSPHGTAADSSDNLWVPDYGCHRIVKFSGVNGIEIATFGSMGSAEGQFISPHSVAIDSAGNLYVTDISNARIQKFDSNGFFISAWGWGVDDGTATYQVCTSACQAGIGGSGAGQFDGPTGIDVDSNDLVLVGDFQNNRIQTFDSNGNLQGQLGIGAACADTPSDFCHPTDIHVDNNGLRYVSDFDNHKVKIYNGGVHIETLGNTAGSGDNQFNLPHGVATSGGLVYVVDHANHRVQIWSSGELIGSATIAGVCEVNFGALNFGEGNPIDHGLGSEGTGEIVANISNDLGNLNSDIEVFGTHWNSNPGGVKIMDGGHTKVSATDPANIAEMTDLSTDPFNPVDLGSIPPQTINPTYWNLQIVIDGDDPGYAGAVSQTITVDFTCS